MPHTLGNDSLGSRPGRAGPTATRAQGPASELEVRDAPVEGRYELVEDDVVIGVADYQEQAGVLVFPHTVIAPDRRAPAWARSSCEAPWTTSAARVDGSSPAAGSSPTSSTTIPSTGICWPSDLWIEHA